MEFPGRCSGPTQAWSIGMHNESRDKFPCPCCGYLTLSEPPPGTFQICPVCYWEDDLAQYVNPTLSGGANPVSLQEAQRNFSDFGAITRNALAYTRPPNEEEIPKSQKDNALDRGNKRME